MSSKYLQSIQEVRQWLGYKKLDEFIYILLDNGYDDLDSIAQATETELEQLKDLFQTADTKKSIETLVISLRQIGIESYRRDKQAFKNMTTGSAPTSKTTTPKTSGIGQALAAKGGGVTQHQDSSKGVERRGGGNKKDIVSVRTNKQSNWSDKYVVLDGYSLKWFNSRRDPSPDQTFALDQSLTALEKTDANTIRLVLTPASTYVELWCPEPEDIEEWEAALSKCLPVSPRQDKPALPVKQNVKKSSHQNQYGRGSDYAEHSQGSDGESNAGTSVPQHDDSSDDDSDERPPMNDGNNRSKFEQTIRASMSMSRATTNYGEEHDDPPSTVNKSQTSTTRNEGGAGGGGGGGLGGLEDDEEEMKMDRNSWEGVMSLHALYRAKLHLAQTIYEKVDEVDLERHYIRSSAHDNKAKKYMATLANGAVFKKFKRGSSATRRIWCTPLFDFVVWGDEDKANVKGFIATTDIQEINQGFGKNKCRIYVVSAGRTLELEAKDSAMAKEWKTLFEFLIQANIYEQEHKKRLAQRKDFREKQQAAKAEFSKLLSNGDVFKKWPGRKSIQKGSVTSRKIWADQSVQKLQWGDIATNKVKGFIELADVVQIEQDPTDKLKFTVFAQKRSLDLEAKSVWVREKWVRALRFFVEFKPKKIVI